MGNNTQIVASGRESLKGLRGIRRIRFGKTVATNSPGLGLFNRTILELWWSKRHLKTLTKFNPEFNPMCCRSFIGNSSKGRKKMK